MSTTDLEMALILECWVIIRDFFLSSVFLSKCFQKNISGKSLEYQTVWIHIRKYILLGLI